jgi:acyl-coenzyme A synthetase/AMP-(fatty) acid ligase
LLNEARAWLCSRTIVHYGATETGPIASTPADLLMEEEGATGFPLPGATIEVVDAEDRLAPSETVGLVRVRTLAMGEPYPPRPKDEHPSLRGGSFYPGDRGRLTKEGMLILEGRASEIINTGGVKRAPELIEELVLRHPNVAEAAAFGAVGADGIEEVNLAVVTRAAIAEKALINWCAARGLEVARVFAVESLPRTQMGKIRRDEVKRSLIG